MKVQLKDVLPGELFWHTEEDFNLGKDEDAGKIIDQTKPMWVWVKRDTGMETIERLRLVCCADKYDALLVDKCDDGLRFDMNQGGVIILNPREENKLLEFLLKRAGKVAVTLEEMKDIVVMRNNHAGFIEELEAFRNPAPKRELPPIEELKPFEKKETEEEFAERHRVKAVDVPVGMTFYTNYNDFNLDIEGMSMTMRKNLHYLHNGYGLESETPLTSEFVYVRHPEECKPKVRTARPGEKEINWGEDAPEDMFVHVGSKDLPDGSREDIYELYSEEKHGDVETWTRSMVMSMNDHMPGRDKAVIRETVKTPVRTEKEIRMEILVLQVELLSVISGSSKEEIIDRCLDRAKKDGMVRKTDLNTKNDF